MPIDLYSFQMSPPCRAVLMTAKQLNINLNVKTIDLTENQQLKPEFLKLNPAHTIPTINDNGFVLWKSKAIMGYLFNQYAPESSLYPKEPKKRALVDRWLNFETTLSSAQKEVTMPKLFQGVDPSEEKVTTFNNYLKIVDQLIGNNKYLTGNTLTLADLSMVATMHILDYIGYDLTKYPNFKRWFTNLQFELPYYDQINKFDPAKVQPIFEKMKAIFAAQAAK